MSLFTHPRIIHRLAVILNCLAWPAVACAAEPKPPMPNPHKPVDYIEWYNRTMGGGVDMSENAAPIYTRAYDQLQDFDGDESHLAAGPWSDDKAGNEWLAKNQEALRLFRQAAGMKRCFFAWKHGQLSGDERADRSLLLTINNGPEIGIRRLTKLLLAEGWRSWTAGKREVIVQNALIALRAGHHLDQSPMTMNRLIGTANLQLGYDALRKALHLTDQPGRLAARILEQIEAADPPRPSIARCYAVERAFGLDICQRLFVPGKKPNEWSLHAPHADMVKQQLENKDLAEAEKAGYARTLGEMNASYDRIEAWLRKPLHSALPEAARIKQQTEQHLNPLARITAGMDRPRVLDERALAHGRAVRLIAHLLIASEKNGQFPAKLDDLQAADLKQLRMDPFSGQDFVYRRLGDGFTLYSVAENQKDDQGRHDESWLEGDYIFWPIAEPAADKK